MASFKKTISIFVTITIRFNLIYFALSIIGCCDLNGMSQFSDKSISTIQMMRLKMTGLPNYLDETVIYYQVGATDGFDIEYDAYKLFGPNPAPHISQESDSVLFSINGISPVIQTFSTSILATTPINGNFTITATDFQTLPVGTCVYLQDLLLGTTVNILVTPYVFNLSNTTTTSRFVLHINHYELPITTEILQPTCQVQNGGQIKVIGNNNSPWNYKWKDSTGTIVKTTVTSNASDSINNLSDGLYYLEITSASNSCYSKNDTFNIYKVNVPTVSFNITDTIIYANSQSIIFNNQSENCVSYFWDFGDESGYSYNIEPNYYYSSSGLYKTTLTGTSSSGCVDSSFKFIHVIGDISTSLKNIHQNDIKLFSAGNNIFIMKFNSSIDNKINLNLYDAYGKNLNEFNKEYDDINKSITIDLSNQKAGTYIIGFNNQFKETKRFKVIVM